MRPERETVAPRRQHPDFKLLNFTQYIGLKPVPTSGRWFPSESGSAQGFFLLSAREFFLATVALGLLNRGRFSVKQLCDKAPLLKALYK